MGIPNLSANIGAALRELVRRFEENSQEFYGGRAWGFSLDPSTIRGQVGIYGTVAAVEVLIRAGYGGSSLVAGGLQSLREGFPDKIIAGTKNAISTQRSSVPGWRSLASYVKPRSNIASGLSTINSRTLAGELTLAMSKKMWAGPILCRPALP